MSFYYRIYREIIIFLGEIKKNIVCAIVIAIFLYLCRKINAKNANFKTVYCIFLTYSSIE